MNGKTVPVSGDPMSPPDTVITNIPSEPGMQAVYSPRVNTDPEGGPWVYQYLRTETAPKPDAPNA